MRPGFTSYDRDEQQSTRKSHFLPVLLIAFGSAAAALPLVYLRRVQSSRLRTYVPPLRSVQSHSPPLLATPAPTPSLKYSTIPPQSNSHNPEALSTRFAPPLRAFAALGIATSAVGVFGAVLILSIQKAFDINTVDQFATLMRTELATRFPAFSHLLHKNLASDAGERDADIQHLDQWDYEASKVRLQRAYREGGLEQWAAAFSKEIQLESQWLLRKRELHNNRSPPP